MMKKLIILLLSMQVLFAGFSVKQDIKGSKDLPFIGRYDGSKIISYFHKNFDSFTLPLSALEAKKDKRDEHNNILFAPKSSKELEGERVRVVYIIPNNVTPLEVIRNYKQELKTKGAKILFECKGSECGGDAHRASSGGGGDMSLAMFLSSQSDVSTYNKDFSNGDCALRSGINNQHFFSAELPKYNTYLSVLTYTSNGSWCSKFNNRVIAIVDAVIVKKREQKMVVIKANEMSKKIKQDGKIALYGIYFDTDKATIKANSKPTLDEIAKMLKSDKSLKILIVGHTDNQGNFEYNLNLSKRRAKAVLNKLASSYGISKSRLKSFGVSFSAPVASNQTEEGRAKNRRVELVRMAK